MSTSEDPNVSVSGSGSDSSRRRRRSRRTKEIRGAWSSEEDAKLTQVVRELGLDNWSRIASHIPGRSYKSCRARWFSCLCYHVDDERQDASELPLLDLFNCLINDPKTPEELKEHYRIRKVLYVQGLGRTYSYHVMGSPLVEISKLTIDLGALDLDLDLSQRQPFHIYGHIILIDQLGNEFLIFKQNQSDPLTLESPPDDHLLHLDNFNFGCPRCLPASFRVLINLKDIHRKKFIVDKDVYVDFNGFNFRDDQRCLCCSSPIWLEGNIYRCAVIAIVDVSVVEGDNVDGDDETESHHHQLNVGGSVLGTIQVTNKQIISRELFSNKSGKPHIINYGEALVDSSTTAMAVPSHSSLVIQLHLTVAGIEISDSLNFKAEDRRGLPDKKVIAGKICNVVVSVKWRHPFRSLPENVSHQWCDDVEGESSEYASSSRAVDTSNNNNNKIHFLSRSTRRSHSQPFYIQPHLLELRSRNWLVRVGPDELCESLMEIFSISICFFVEFGACSDLSIHGAMRGYIENGQNSIDYFKLEEMEHSYEMGVGILHPHGPKSCHLSSHFGMSLDLKDAGGREISYGYFSWADFQHEGWMNRRLCSVIPGKHGYAAVHYMIIEDALQAKLKCILSSNDGSVVVGCDIRGVICARYSNYRYATAHDKAYYQSTLFKGFGHVGDDGEVPLFKSVVAVPIISGLIVSVDIKLKLSESDADAWIMMHGAATFRPRKCLDPRGTTVYLPDKKLVSAVGNYSIAAYVEWE